MNQAVTQQPLLSVEKVTVDLPTARGNLRAVDQVDLKIAPGQTLGIVGESGCVKTMLSRAILQLLPKKAKLGGRVMFDGKDLTKLDPDLTIQREGRHVDVSVAGHPAGEFDAPPTPTAQEWAAVTASALSLARTASAPLAKDTLS